MEIIHHNDIMEVQHNGGGGDTFWRRCTGEEIENNNSSNNTILSSDNEKADTRVLLNSISTKHRQLFYQPELSESERVTTEATQLRSEVRNSADSGCSDVNIDEGDDNTRDRNEPIYDTNDKPRDSYQPINVNDTGNSAVVSPSTTTKNSKLLPSKSSENSALFYPFTTSVAPDKFHAHIRSRSLDSAVFQPKIVEIDINDDSGDNDNGDGRRNDGNVHHNICVSKTCNISDSEKNGTLAPSDENVCLSETNGSDSDYVNHIEKKINGSMRDELRGVNVQKEIQKISKRKHLADDNKFSASKFYVELDNPNGVIASTVDNVRNIEFQTTQKTNVSLTQSNEENHTYLDHPTSNVCCRDKCFELIETELDGDTLDTGHRKRSQAIQNENCDCSCALVTCTKPCNSKPTDQNDKTTNQMNVNSGKPGTGKGNSKLDSATSSSQHKQTVIIPCCAQQSEGLNNRPCENFSSHFNESLSSSDERGIYLACGESQSQTEKPGFVPHDISLEKDHTPLQKHDDYNLDKQESIKSALSNSTCKYLESGLGEQHDCCDENELNEQKSIESELEQFESSSSSSFTNTTLCRSSPRILRANKQDLKGVHRRTSSTSSTVAQQKQQQQPITIVPKKNIKQDFLFVKDANLLRSPFCVDDSQVLGNHGLCDDLVSTKRRRSLSEGDLYLPLTTLSSTSTDEYQDTDERRKVGCGGSKSFSEGFNRQQRRPWRSCSDVSLFYESFIRNYEAEDNGYEEESESYETDISGDEEEVIPPYEIKDKRNFVKERGDESPRIRLAKRRRIRNKQSFIAKSISVDPKPQNDRYFSNIRNRRNGIVKPVEENSVLNDDDYLADLIEFKRLHKKPKKGLRLVKSVENFFDKSLLHHHPNISKADSSPVPGNKLSKHSKHRFLSALFTKHEKMEYLRETNILESETTDFACSQPDKSIAGNSIRKVAGIIELYIDSQGDVIRKLEITKIPGHSLGFFIRYGNGIDRTDGIFISRVTLGSFVDENNLLHSGDEILQVNKVDVTGRTLEQVAAMMQTTERLIIKTRSALPLPMNTSPLLRNYSQKKQKKHHAEDSSSYESLYQRMSSAEGGNSPQLTGKMTRTWSDPNQINEFSFGKNGNSENDLGIPQTRGRSRSAISQQEKSFTRGELYRNGPTAPSRSPVYNRKLPSIPDEFGVKQPDINVNENNNNNNNNNKSFSRAHRYQAARKTSFDHDGQQLDYINKPKPEINTLCLPTPNAEQPARSPCMVRRYQQQSQQQKRSPATSDSSILSVPSSDSLSSMSDSEDLMTLDDRLHVYPSDNAVPSGPLKSYTGKLVVSIYKLIGRLSRIDADCYCTIEVDGEFKATTQLKPIKELVHIRESFEIDIQKSSILTFYIFHKQGKKQHKLASQATIYLQNVIAPQAPKKKILLGTSNHVQMRLKLNFTAAETYIQRSPSLRQNGVFGFNLSKTLAKEENTIPVIVRKCVEEIEKRGLDLTGIYRISGNARRKKQLRAQFEENSLAVDVSNEDEVDCHILAGILKDYLRELPNPLISNDMYHNIYNKAHVKSKNQNKLLQELMIKLPYTNRATLIYIMDHLKRVSAKCDVNKMTNQNLAVCFGPVMMSSPLEAADMLDFKKQIDALEFLLNIWPSDVEHQNGI